MNYIRKQFIGANQVDQTKILIDNNSFLRGRNFANSGDVNLLRVNISDEIEIGTTLNLGGFRATNSGAAVGATDLVTKSYVDALAAGVDPKESVHLATTSVSDFTGASYATTPSNGRFTSGPTSLDSVSVVTGRRYLIKDRADQKQNGIYVYDGAGQYTRAPDQDGSPASEVSGGNFTFVEQGTSQAGRGYVVVGNGILTLNTDNIVWTLFSTVATNTFTDDLFRIKDNGDLTKQLAFEVAAISAATTRTITVGDESINISTGASSSFLNRTLSNGSGTLPVANGGTNIATYAVGDILYASATGVLSKLPIGTAAQILTVAAGLPSWATQAAAANTALSNLASTAINTSLIFGSGVAGILKTIDTAGASPSLSLSTGISSLSGQDSGAMSLITGAGTVTNNGSGSWTGGTGSAVGNRRSGSVNLTSGTTVGALSGDINISSGTGGASGNINIFTPDNSGGGLGGSQGNILISAGHGGSSGPAGTLTISTTNNSSSASGAMSIFTGAQVNGNGGDSGALSISTGNSAGHNSGNLTISIGTAGGGNGGAGIRGLIKLLNGTEGVTGHIAMAQDTTGGMIWSSSGLLSSLTISSTTLATPAAPSGTPLTTGGTLVAGSNFAKIVAVDVNGRVTTAGAESATVTTTTATSSIVWSWTAIPGAASYQIWVSTTAGTEASFFTSNGSNTRFLQTTTSGTAGTIPATANTGFLITNAFAGGTTTTATAAGTTTLTPISTMNQQFTGVTTQTAVLPDATRLPVGTTYNVLNRSTGIVTVNANGGGLLAAVSGGSQGQFTLVSNGTSAGTWDVALTSNGANQALSNLTSPTAINQALLFGSGVAGSLKTADNTGATQNLLLATGQNTTAAAASGSITVQTGQSNPTAGATSGSIALNTGNGNGASGGISFNTGLSNNAASGGMSFNIGNSQSTNSGSFSFLTGTNGGNASTGGFSVTTGNCTTSPTGFFSGSINLTTGSGLTSAGSGNISLITGAGASAIGTIKFFRTGIAPVVGQPWIASVVDGTGYYGSLLGPAIYGLSTSLPFYTTGTASQSGTTVTGSGTTFTAAMVGMYFVWGSGLTSGIITAFTSGTQITVSTSQTIGAGTGFSINRPILSSPIVTTDSRPNGAASGAGGTIPAGANFAKIVAIDGFGNQSAPSTESVQINTAGATSSITWTWAPVPGAVSYQIWVSTTTGTEANFFTSISNSFVQTLPAASGTAGTIPVLNATRPTFVSGLSIGGVGVSLNGSTSGSLIHKASAATTSYTVTWPATQGAAGTVPTNDGAGNLTWTAPGAGSGPSWTKYTVSHTALQAAALTNDIQLFSLPTNGVIQGVVISHSTAFSGGAIATYTISVGITGNLTKYAGAFDVFQATGAGVGQTTNVMDFEDKTTTTSIRIAAVSTGANLNQSTTGSVDVWVLTSTLP